MDTKCRGPQIIPISFRLKMKHIPIIHTTDEMDVNFIAVSFALYGTIDSKFNATQIDT